MAFMSLPLAHLVITTVTKAEIALRGKHEMES